MVILLNNTIKINKMEKIIEKEKHKGYKIGNDILIHRNINDPESWFLTIRPLNVFGKRLCPLNSNEQEIARYINVILHKELNVLNETIEQVIPFT